MTGVNVLQSHQTQHIHTTLIHTRTFDRRFFFTIRRRLIVVGDGDCAAGGIADTNAFAGGVLLDFDVADAGDVDVCDDGNVLCVVVDVVAGVAGSLLRSLCARHHTLDTSLSLTQTMSTPHSRLVLMTHWHCFAARSACCHATPSHWSNRPCCWQYRAPTTRVTAAAVRCLCVIRYR
jgi:hypothetical protein